MTAPRLGRSPTCLNCLRQLAQPRLATTMTAAPASLVQARHRTTKAELEDLQGIPVRLLDDIVGFGRKHAIIRVKPGRMRNFWFPKSLAEYMTRDRFRELGLTDAAIGVRDRTFGTHFVVDEETARARAKARQERRAARRPTTDKKATIDKIPEVPMLQPKDALGLLEYIIPQRLTFYRKPITTSSGTVPSPAAAAPSEAVSKFETYPTPSADPEPAAADSAETATTTDTETAAAATAEEPGLEPQPATGPTAGPMPAQGEAVPIFGSVSRHDILTIVREALSVHEHSSRVVLEDSHIEIHGLEPNEDRIKRLGSYYITISVGKGAPRLVRVVDVSASDS